MLDTRKVFYDGLTYIYLEMPKFRLKESELPDEFEKWIFALKQIPNLKVQPDSLREKIFGQLFDQAELANLNEREYEMCEDGLKVYRDLQNILNTAFSEGIEQGREEEKMEMARRMLAAGGYKHSDISQLVGLSMEELSQL